MGPPHGGDTLDDGGWQLAQLVVAARWPLCPSWGREGFRDGSRHVTWLWVRPCNHAATSVSSWGLVRPSLCNDRCRGMVYG